MCFPDREDLNDRPEGSFRRSPETTLQSQVIVRLDPQNRMVTKDYRKGLYEWVEHRVIRVMGDLETACGGRF